MVFSSFLFIYLFLPLLLVAYYCAPSRAKNYVLLAASLGFYFWGAPYVVTLLIATSLIDIIVSHRFEGAWRRLYLIVGIGINLSALIYFKYANFFVEELNTVIVTLGGSPWAWTSIVLPAGISFFTFEKISYLVDVYQRKVVPAKNIAHYLLFVSLFPHLIAGPILKYHDLADQIAQRSHSVRRFYEGMVRFCCGLSKKMLVADEMGRVADNIFKLSSADLTTPYAWLGVFAYGLQIYYDFCGYSDMAVGLARMFGFNFIENFNAPYTASSVTDFWKRWHISLTNWMREYLYIPLGGNRCGELTTYRNLSIVFFLSGFWHGASWNFILWGCYHGCWLVVERLCLLSFLQKIPKLCSVSITLVIVMLGWVLFRAKDLTAALQMYEVLFGFGAPGWHLPRTMVADVIHTRAVWVMLIASFAAVVSMPSWLSNIVRGIPQSLKDAGVGLIAIVGFILSTAAIAEGTVSPFLYFRF